MASPSRLRWSFPAMAVKARSIRLTWSWRSPELPRDRQRIAGDRIQSLWALDAMQGPVHFWYRPGFLRKDHRHRPLLRPRPFRRGAHGWGTLDEPLGGYD